MKLILSDKPIILPETGSDVKIADQTMHRLLWMLDQDAGEVCHS